MSTGAYTCRDFLADGTTLSLPYNAALRTQLQTELLRATASDVTPTCMSAQCPLAHTSTVSNPDLVYQNLTTCMTCLQGENRLGSTVAGAQPHARAWGCATCGEVVAPLAYDLARQRGTIGATIATFTTPTATELQVFLLDTEAQRAAVFTQFQKLSNCVRTQVIESVCFTASRFNVVPDVAPPSAESGTSYQTRDILLGVLLPLGVMLLVYLGYKWYQGYQSWKKGLTDTGQHGIDSRARTHTARESESIRDAIQEQQEQEQLQLQLREQEELRWQQRENSKEHQSQQATTDSKQNPPQTPLPSTPTKEVNRKKYIIARGLIRPPPDDILGAPPASQRPSNKPKNSIVQPTPAPTPNATPAVTRRRKISRKGTSVHRVQPTPATKPIVTPAPAARKPRISMVKHDSGLPLPPLPAGSPRRKEPA
jgi:hypothetical protein